MMKDYPKLINPEIISKRFKKRGKKAAKGTLQGSIIKQNETDNPIEWLRRCYWSSLKEFKSTLILDFDKNVFDLGNGDLNCFEYLKY